jgi:hypothetical protein
MRISDLPSEWWKTKRACQTLSQQFGNHVVALFVVYKTQQTATHALYTGFLYSHQGIPLWMSAGHVFSELERLREIDVEIVKAEWVDLVDDGSRHGVPVDLRDLRYLPVNQGGVDFGFVLLGSYYERLFRLSQGNTFLDERGYFRRDQAKPEGFYLVGFPSERHDVSEREIGTRTERRLFAPLYCLPVEEIPDRPSDDPATFWGCGGCLYFQMVPFADDTSSSPKSIISMSGGCVLSIERTPEERMKYYLFGLQSAWLPERRIIRATDLECIAAIIDGLFKSMREVTLDP